jgi:hypothetical protein
MIFNREYNRIRFTPGQFYFNSILYKVDGVTWKSMYGQGTPATTVTPTSSNGYILDHTYTSSTVTSYTSDPVDISTQQDKMIADFLFLAVRSEYSRATETQNLSTLFTSAEYDITRRVIPYRVICDAPDGVSFDSRSVLSETLGFSAGTNIVPLDASLVNLERLKTRLLNKNIMMPVIDKMRQDATLAPYLDPNNGQSLIPLMIAFRQVDGTGAGYTDIQTGPLTIMRDVSGTPGATACNPVNILTFFEIQASSFAIFGTNFAAQEVFETLPFLD